MLFFFFYWCWFFFYFLIFIYFVSYIIIVHKWFFSFKKIFMPYSFQTNCAYASNPCDECTEVWQALTSIHRHNWLTMWSFYIASNFISFKQILRDKAVAKLYELGKELKLYYNLLVLVYPHIRQWQFSGNIKLTFG